jgi:hypothetical protein
LSIGDLPWSVLHPCDGLQWISVRGRKLFCIKAGKASARSPRHFPIAEARRIRLQRIAERKAFEAEVKQVAGTLREAELSTSRRRADVVMKISGRAAPRPF